MGADDQPNEVEAAAREQSAAALAEFGTTHPDWKAREPAMVALAHQLSPRGLTQAEYLEILYNGATVRDQRVAGGTAADRVDEQPRRRAPEGPVTFQTAYEDAKQGIEYEDEDDANDSASTADGGSSSFRSAFEAAMRGEQWDDD